jgi:hypothetical protein
MYVIISERGSAVLSMSRITALYDADLMSMGRDCVSEIQQPRGKLCTYSEESSVSVGADNAVATRQPIIRNHVTL